MGRENDVGPLTYPKRLSGCAHASGKPPRLRDGRQAGTSLVETQQTIYHSGNGQPHLCSGMVCNAKSRPECARRHDTRNTYACFHPYNVMPEKAMHSTGGHVQEFAFVITLSLAFELLTGFLGVHIRTRPPAAGTGTDPRTTHPR